MELDFALVDAFAAQAFAGNPGGVVLQARHLTDQQMQLMAREIRASSTAFVLPATTPQGRLRLRWFTPSVEASMCGHATIAAVHALVESGEFAGLVRVLVTQYRGRGYSTRIAGQCRTTLRGKVVV